MTDTQTKSCTQCGSLFEVSEDEVWKKLCYPCWRKTKGKVKTGTVHIYQSSHQAAPEFNREVATLKAELITSQHDVRRLTHQLDRVTAQLAMAQAEVARSRLGRTRTTGTIISKEMLRFLRQRCHPDKCTDKDTSNEVMQWLNQW